MKIKKRNHIMILHWIGGIWVFIALISLCTIIVLNCTSIYKLVIDYFELPYETEVTRQSLLINYKEIIKYLQIPWISELNMPYFPMSKTGKIHFKEVKEIFQMLYIVLILFVIMGTIAFHKKIQIIPILKKGANITFIISSLLGFFMLIDFLKIFLLFHEIIFKNNYWFFDPLTDPVILALPVELFGIMGIIIMVLTNVLAVFVKIVCTKIEKSNFKI